MDVRLLGPVEASVDGRAVAVGAGKPRALLALLALHAGSTVSSDRLIEGLWDEPPATAVKLVQLHVSQLRKALGPAGDPHARSRVRAAARARGPRRHALRAARGRRPTARGRSRCGAVPRSTTSPASRSPPPRSAGWRSSGWRPSSRRSRSTWARADTARWSASSSGSCSRSRCGRRSTRSGCWRCTAPAGRPTRSRPTARRGRRSWSSMGVEPGPELRRMHEAILRQDRSLEPAVELIRLRVADAASRLAAERPALRAVEDDLAGGVVELQSRRLGPRARRRRRASARSRAWPRSTSRTPASSSAVSGSSPNWSRGSPAPR